MPNIFISYRREDSAGYAQAVYSRLAQHFSKDRIFMDVDTIAPGADFERAIETAVSECEVLVAVIGKRWMGADATGVSRFENTKDYVRLELSTALDRDIRVIPVLVDGMTMPSEEILPVNLRPITRRHAIEISNTRFSFDVERLLTAIRQTVPELGAKQRQNQDETTPTAPHEVSAPRRSSFQPLLYTGIGVILALVFAGIVLWRGNLQDQDSISNYFEKADPKKVESKPANQTSRPVSPTERAPVLSSGTIFRDHLKSGRDGPEMIVISAGSFRMGDSQRKEKREIPVHSVRIPKAFAIGRYEVTFAEYEQFAIATNRQFPPDEGWGRGRRPAIYISWQEAIAYTKWLSAQSGKRYRLPNEAEWEYAARGGKETAYWWGDEWQNGMANCAGCDSPFDKKTAPVGSFKPNPFGLYDTAGNVWEWVKECWHENYSGAPADGSTWISGGNCSRRVRRGGSYAHPQRSSRSSSRERYYPENHSETIGFRVFQELD